MKKIIVLALLAQTFVSAFAGTFDVIPKKSFKKGSTYVRVIHLENDRIRFEECKKGLEMRTCKTIGPKYSYTRKSLLKLRRNENLELAGTITADVVIVVAAALSGGAVVVGGVGVEATGYLLIDLAAKAFYTAGAGVGMAGGAALGLATTSSFDHLNPQVQADQARTLDSDILDDKLVAATDIEEYILNLETVLNKI